MSKFIASRVAAAVVFVSSFVGGASAQLLPLSDYGDSRGIYRFGINIQGQGGTVSDRFDLKSGDIIPFDIFTIQDRYPQYTDTSLVQTVLDYRGVEVFVTYLAGDQSFRLRVPTFDANGATYALVYTGADREESSDAAISDVFDPETATGEDFQRRLYRAWVRVSPVDPLAGNPGSVQGVLARASLDLSSGDSAIETSGERNNSFMLGAQYRRVSSGRFDVDQLDVSSQRGFRVFEGRRVMLKLVGAGNLQVAKGGIAGASQTGLGLEVPLIEGRWSIEPRIAYGLSADDKGTFGNAVNATVASRVVLGRAGRARIVLGNMVGRFETLGTRWILRYDANPGVKNTVFRNGIAAELPLNRRAGKRASSLRASYVHTLFTGTKVYANQYHEVALSWGIRGREESQRNLRDTLRLFATGTKAGGYKAVTVGIGARF